MRMFCYYYDEAKQGYFETSYWAMKEIEGIRLIGVKNVKDAITYVT